MIIAQVSRLGRGATAPQAAAVPTGSIAPRPRPIVHSTDGRDFGHSGLQGLGTTNFPRAVEARYTSVCRHAQDRLS